MRSLPGGWTVLFWMLAIARPASAQQRPNEEELFGAPPPDGGTPAAQAPERQLPQRPEQPTETPATRVVEGSETRNERSRDLRALSSPATSDLFASEPARDNPLTIGGQIYLRSVAQVSENQDLDKARFLLPAIVDAYFDARPSDRVRGMILGRMTYDPTLDPNGANPAFGSGTSGLTLPTLPTSRNPGVGLDQLWVNFDIAHTLFVTAGRQHVKWGVSRFWNPTDFLTPQRRDPLAVFDARLGASMVKLHLPSESHGWNLYAIGLIDNAGPASTLGQLGGAIRGEITLGRGEVGVEAVFQPRRKVQTSSGQTSSGGSNWRFGLDASSAIGPLDAYAEVALRKGTDTLHWRINPTADPSLGYLGQFESYQPTDLNAAASGGFNTTIVLGENNSLLVGAEYFYNSVGYDSERYYPWLIGQGAFLPFYTGRHYGAVYATFTSPSILGGSDSFILTTLSNLSDRSAITRFDFLTRVLSYLYLEAFVAVHYGRHGGEFRLQVNIPDQAIFIPAPLFDAGLGVRIKI